MNVSCPSCGASIVAQDVNVVRMVAKCRDCNAVFAFEDQLTRAAPPPAREAKMVRPAVPLPDGLVLTVGQPAPPADYRSAAGGSGELTLTRRWFGPQHLFMLFFCIAWDAFLVFWYGIAIKSGGPWIMFVFPIAHLAVGVGITYSALCGLLNRTVIQIKDGVLSVRHGPIPARGNRTIPVHEVRQLYTEEVVGSKGAKTYKLNAVVASGSALALASDLSNPQQALFIERAVEDHLGLADQPVAGAFTG